ncbi:MAG: hypothetical protein FJZ95_01960 [Chloroflexi bacterium]|nr:hypothetical protein [Chloroflexota bacterium]
MILHHPGIIRDLADLIVSRIETSRKTFAVAIAGESGSGKTELASALLKELSTSGIRTLVLHQDDYFVLPPKTNEAMRRKDIGRVGMGEVQLALLDQHLGEIKEGKKEITMPRMIFDENRADEETMDIDGVQAVIVEGTYTTTLRNLDLRVFIDRTYLQTRNARRLRARETQDEFLERVLEIEHGIISRHKASADIVVRAVVPPLVKGDAGGFQIR